MELFLLLLPAVIIPIGISLAGIWWLLSDDGDTEQGDEFEDEYDGDGF